MQPLDVETTSSATPLQCATEILEVIPLIMQALRRRIGDKVEADLTVPQFRTLMFLQHQPAGSVSEVAEHIGLALPSMSKLIDGLVARNFLTRTQHPTDRRRLQLALTPQGSDRLARAHALAQQALAESLAQCTEADRLAIQNAMRMLRPVFLPESRFTRVNPPERGNP
ncbi:MAG: MarR family winged helix-turn-helix transcriptional regulator [Phycisphaerae bacterium]